MARIVYLYWAITREKALHLAVRGDRSFCFTSKWGRSHQIRRIAAASKRARINPPINFHILRHTYASELVSRGVPLQFVSELLGHHNTAIAHKHYAHLQPSALKDAVRQFLPDHSKDTDNSIISLEKALN